MNADKGHVGVTGTCGENVARLAEQHVARIVHERFSGSDGPAAEFQVVDARQGSLPALGSASFTDRTKRLLVFMTGRSPGGAFSFCILTGCRHLSCTRDIHAPGISRPRPVQTASDADRILCRVARDGGHGRDGIDVAARGRYAPCSVAVRI